MGTQGGTPRLPARTEAPRGQPCSGEASAPSHGRAAARGAERERIRGRAAQGTPGRPTRAALGLVLTETGPTTPPWRGSAHPSPHFFGFGFKENLPVAGLSTWLLSGSHRDLLQVLPASPGTWLVLRSPRASWRGRACSHTRQGHLTLPQLSQHSQRGFYSFFSKEPSRIQSRAALTQPCCMTG